MLEMSADVCQKIWVFLCIWIARYARKYPRFDLFYVKKLIFKTEFWDSIWIWVNLLGPKSILKSLRKGNYLFFMISIWLDPKILIIWQKIQNLNDHFDSNQNWAQSKTRLKLKLSLELDLFWLNIKLSPKYWFKMIFFSNFFLKRGSNNFL